jgi:hypothetical protein
MNNPPDTQTLAKLFVAGDGKVGKTYFAVLAAKAGFRILCLDGDVAAQTIAAMVANGTLTDEEASRIYLLDIGDTMAGGMRDTKMIEFMNEFISNTVIRWDDTNQKLANRNTRGVDIWEIRPGLMGPNDIIMFDSWTSYSESAMLWAGRINGVDIFTAKTHELRPAYQGAGLKATELCCVIKSSPCHWIVLGHTDEYQHTTVKDGTNRAAAKEKDQTIDWTKMIPRSVSKPHGFQIPKYFTDFAWMEVAPNGVERRLDFKPRPDRVGGGHFGEKKSIEEYSFLNLVRQMKPGFTPDPNAPMPWLNIIPAGENVADAAPEATTESKVLDGTQAKAITGGGMSSLFAKK